MAVAVVQGSYSPFNISTVPRIEYGQMCTTVMGGVRLYGFQPTSDVASVFGSCSPNPCFTRSISSSGNISGYWSGGEFVRFTPGVYTVVAADEWGQIALTFFTVQD